MAEVCRGLGVPLVIDAAQALGHLDCAVDADAIYSSSRKWMAGPRGVGILAIRPELAAAARPRLPPPDWDLPLTVLERLENGEANVAARVGYSVALGEHLAAGPDEVRARLAELGRLTRAALADVARLASRRADRRADGDHHVGPRRRRRPRTVRSWLIAERGIVTTYAEVQRAPFELRAPVLRVSPHVDSTAEDLDTFAEALAAATAQV